MENNTEQNYIKLRKVESNLYDVGDGRNYFRGSDRKLYAQYKGDDRLFVCTKSGEPDDEVPTYRYQFPNEETFAEKLDQIVKQATLISSGQEAAQAVFMPCKIVRGPEFDKDHREELFQVQAADGKRYDCPFQNLMISVDRKKEPALNELGLLSKRQLLRMKKVIKLSQSSSYGQPKNVDEAFSQFYMNHFRNTSEDIREGGLESAAFSAVIDLAKQKKFAQMSICSTVRSTSPAATYNAAEAKKNIDRYFGNNASR